MHPANSLRQPEVSSDASEALESLHTFLKCDHLSGGADDTEWPEGRGTCPTETGIKVARRQGVPGSPAVATGWALFLHLCGAKPNNKNQSNACPITVVCLLSVRIKFQNIKEHMDLKGKRIFWGRRRTSGRWGNKISFLNRKST